jgi:hypothetical protein
LSNESSSLSAYIMREHEESTSTSLVVGSCDERKQHEKVSPVHSLRAFVISARTLNAD